MKSSGKNPSSQPSASINSSAPSRLDSDTHAPSSGSPPSNLAAAGTHPFGRPWTSADDDVLLACVQRHGQKWTGIHSSFNGTASGSRSISALANRYRELHDRGRAPLDQPQSASASSTAPSSSNSNSAGGPSATPSTQSSSSSRIPTKRKNPWSDEELDILRRGLARHPRFGLIWADYEAAIPQSRRRSRSAVRTRVWQLRGEEGAAGTVGMEDGMEDGEEEGGEEEGEVVREIEKDLTSTPPVRSSAIEAVNHSTKGAEQHRAEGHGQEEAAEEAIAASVAPPGPTAPPSTKAPPLELDRPVQPSPAHLPPATEALDLAAMPAAPPAALPTGPQAATSQAGALDAQLEAQQQDAQLPQSSRNLAGGGTSMASSAQQPSAQASPPPRQPSTLDLPDPLDDHHDSSSSATGSGQQLATASGAPSSGATNKQAPSVPHPGPPPIPPWAVQSSHKTQLAAVQSPTSSGSGSGSDMDLETPSPPPKVSAPAPSPPGSSLLGEPKRKDGWRERELQVLQRGLDEGKDVGAICEDFKTAFPPSTSKRTREAVTSMVARLRESGGGGVDDAGNSEVEENGSQEVGSEEERDDEMSGTANTSATTQGPDLSNYSTEGGKQPQPLDKGQASALLASMIHTSGGRRSCQASTPAVSAATSPRRAAQRPQSHPQHQADAGPEVSSSVDSPLDFSEFLNEPVDLEAGHGQPQASTPPPSMALQQSAASGQEEDNAQNEQRRHGQPGGLERGGDDAEHSPSLPTDEGQHHQQGEDDSNSPATNSQPFRGPTRALHNWQLTRADRWTSTDDQLLLDTVALYRGSSDSWATIVDCFNAVSDKQRTFPALESRWRFLQGSKKTRNQTSAPAPVVGGSTTAAVSYAASTPTPTPTPAPPAGQRKAATKAGWSSEEVQVLRQSLRQHPGIPGSYPAIYEQFHKTFPTSTRTRSALRLKCETMIGLAARRDEYQSTDDGEGDSGEESERGAGKRGAKRAGGLVEKVGNVTKRPVNKTPRLYYDDGEGARASPRAASRGERVVRSSRATGSPRATRGPRAMSSARATRTPPHDHEACSRQAHEPDNTTWTRQAHDPSVPLDYGLAVSVTYHASGILVTGIFPGLEVLVFSPTCVQLKSAADLADSYEGQPAFHLKVAEDGSVQAVVTPPGATMGVRSMPEEGQRVGGAREGAAVRGAVQSSCTGVDGFEVALRS